MTGSRRLMLGEAMSIFARSVLAPSGNSPARMRRNRSRFSSTGAIAVWRLPAGLGQRAAVLADLIGREVVDVRLARADELLGPLVELLEVVAGVIEVLAPVEAEPADVAHDRVDVLLALLGGIGVVEAQVAAAAELPGHAEVEADRLGVADVEIAVRLGRKARDHLAAEAAGAVVLDDDLADEVAGLRSRRSSAGSYHHTVWTEVLGAKPTVTGDQCQAVGTCGPRENDAVDWVTADALWKVHGERRDGRSDLLHHDSGAVDELRQQRLRASPEVEDGPGSIPTRPPRG